MMLGSLLRSAPPPPPLVEPPKTKMAILPQRKKEIELPKTATGMKQTIQARHGTATFVPKGHTIKVINTYGKQVVDFWGFALHAPPTTDEWEEDNRGEEEVEKNGSDGLNAEHLDGVDESGEDQVEPPADETENEEGGDAPSLELDITTKSASEESHVLVEKEQSISEDPTSGDSTAGEGSHVLVQKDDLGLPSNDETEKKIAEAMKKAELEGDNPPTEQVDEKDDTTPTGQSHAQADDEKPHDTLQNSTDPATESTETKMEAVSEDVKPVKGWSSYIPSVRSRGKQAANVAQDQQQDGSSNVAADNASKGWGSYLPSVRGLRKSTKEKAVAQDERTWGSYIPSGQGFNSYLPDKSAISSFAALHQRDTSKSVAEQLYDFSKTPVGAAGLSVATGSGYASSIYAAYSAYSGLSGIATDQPGMEFLSMAHTRTSTVHLSPLVGDILVTNLRAPLLTMVEDSGDCMHDTLMAACDPILYRELGVQNWEEHGSCAENLVLALQELNKQVGLKGQKAIGGDVTVNQVPAPLNLFMNVPWSEDGKLNFLPPKGKRGSFVKFRAERDVVVVMSACPQDITEVNGKKPKVAHFLVEEPSKEDQEISDVLSEEARKIIEKAKRRMEAMMSVKAPPQPVRQSSSRQTDEPTPSRRLSGRGPPRKLERIPTSRKSSSQISVPQKETQRVEPSDPPTPRIRPHQPPLQSVQPAPPAPPAPSIPRSISRPARNRPRKLERRTPSAATPR